MNSQLEILIENASIVKVVILILPLLVALSFLGFRTLFLVSIALLVQGGGSDAAVTPEFFIVWVGILLFAFFGGAIERRINQSARQHKELIAKLGGEPSK